MIRADVVIIGAGPAGAEAAYNLSESGLRVVVLEKLSLDREKPCGGAIQTGELLEFGTPPPLIIEREVREARIFGPNGSFLSISTIHSEQSGITVKRSAYDSWLQSRASNAQFIEKAGIVSILKNKGVWNVVVDTPLGNTGVETPILIHAAGANASHLESRLDLTPLSNKGMGITCQFWLDAGQEKLDRAFKNSIEFHFLPHRVPEGYFWLFPKKDVLVAGVGTTIDIIRAKRISLKNELEAFLKENLERLGLSGLSVIRQDGGKMPMRLRRPLYGDGFLVVGDAAGVGSILHGGGIYQARKSAVLASEAIKGYFSGEVGTLSGYEERVHDYFNERERRWDLRLKPFLTDENLVKLILDRGRSDSTIREGLGILLSSTEGHRKSYELVEEASFGLIAEELDSIIREEKELIDKGLKELFKEDSELHRMANEVLLHGGKRLRAVLVLLAGQALGAELNDLLPVAMAYEVSHTASLVHDDIIDGGEWRRGAETLHRRYGIGHAITAGDALLIKGFEMMSSYEANAGVDKARVIKLIKVGCRSGLEASEGEVRDINFSPEEIESKSLEDYIELIRMKTGALLEAATEAGAILANASQENVKAMREFGKNLGIAFQIYDDAKDLLASSTVSLKSRFTDIKKGKLTAQLIHTMNSASSEDRKRLLHLLSLGTTESAHEILDLYRRYDALGYNQKLSREYLERALQTVNFIPSNPFLEKLKDIVRVLGYWTRFAVSQENQ